MSLWYPCYWEGQRLVILGADQRSLSGNESQIHQLHQGSINLLSAGTLSKEKDPEQQLTSIGTMGRHVT